MSIPGKQAYRTVRTVLVGAVVLAVGASCATSSVGSARTSEGMHFFTFMVANRPDFDPGHRLVMEGHGTFDPNNLHRISGGGVYFNFDSAPEGTPKPLVGLRVGKWQVKRAVSFTTNGSYGAATSGVLDMVVEIAPDDGDTIEATLKVVCNVPPGGLVNTAPDGSTYPEGIILTVPGVGTYAAIVSSEPGVPTFGLTLMGPVR